jgi:hypothetical protein
MVPPLRQGRRAAGQFGARMVQGLRPDQVGPQFAGIGAPPRQVVGQQFDGGEGSLAAPELDRIGDVGALRPDVALDVRSAEQVAQVRVYPVAAGLDEEVVVDRFDIRVDGAEELLDQR